MEKKEEIIDKALQEAEMKKYMGFYEDEELTVIDVPENQAPRNPLEPEKIEEMAKIETVSHPEIISLIENIEDDVSTIIDASGDWKDVQKYTLTWKNFRRWVSKVRLKVKKHLENVENNSPSASSASVEWKDVERYTLTWKNFRLWISSPFRGVKKCLAHQKDASGIVKTNAELKDVEKYTLTWENFRHWASSSMHKLRIYLKVDTN